MLGALVGIVLFKDANAVLLGLGAVGVHQVYKQSKNEDIPEPKKEIENGKNG